MNKSIISKRGSSRLYTVTVLPVYFLFHIGGVAAAVVGQQEASITQPVDINFNVGAIHHDDISCWGLASYLQAALVIIC